MKVVQDREQFCEKSSSPVRLQCGQVIQPVEAHALNMGHVGSNPILPTFSIWGSGGNSRRASFGSWWPHNHAGAIPVSPTTDSIEASKSSRQTRSHAFLRLSLQVR